ncbi:GNAT family N-acetyltransferase [Eupransor demetentiae]|uniref:Ribosomal protein S18 acetylase RimI and related acetyltransferases (RimI) n=1 Tax=Eupransor demetentiae TaxID=3109584 RepID=A0ABM9N422_9LACO|nr:Ribosomal protein S18 acetylase RimI and related acetyltransferases (RimI) [Lactobacillaceae bacterium LMG 33000]
MIRPAKLSDIKALNALNKNEMGYDFPLEDARQQLALILADSEHHVLAVFEDEQSSAVRGYIHAELYREIYAEDAFNLLALAVDSSQQGQGIGSALHCWHGWKRKRSSVASIQFA